LSPLKNPKGTAVWMKMENTSDRSRKDVFDAYASPENDDAFSRTVVPVKMAEQSPNDLISRSQATRLLLRIDNAVLASPHRHHHSSAASVHVDRTHWELGSRSRSQNEPPCPSF
jgi:hypothetical protein